MLFLAVTLFVVLCNISLGLITLFKNPKSASGILFFILSIILALWAITNYFSLQDLPPEKILFSRIKMAASRTHTLIEKTQMYKILLAEQKIYSRYWCFIFDTDSDDVKHALQHLAKTQSNIKYLNYAVIDLGVDGKVIIGLLQLKGKLKKMTVLERFPLFIY